MHKQFKWAALLLFALPACHSGSGSTATDTAASANSAVNKPDSSKMTAAPLSADDQAFMTDVAEAGMTEIQASQAAQSISRNQRVKDFASMMVSDHTKWGDNLKKLAQARNVTLPATPTPAQQAAVASLQKKSGTTFDKDYMRMMVHDHEGAVHLFEKGQKSVKDTALMTFVDNTLPGIRMHLDSARAIDKAL